jgi:hypothetical protein
MPLLDKSTISRERAIVGMRITARGALIASLALRYAYGF